MAATGENEYTVINKQVANPLKLYSLMQVKKIQKNSKRNIIFWSGCGDYYQIVSEKTAALETHSADTVLRKK